VATAARKARKRAGIPFTKPQKTPTPLEERAFVTQPVLRRAGDAMPVGAPAFSTHRSPKRVERFLKNGGRP
jgi:hypothetical protein